MDTSPWFDGLPVLGELPLEELAAKLHEVGEDEVANKLEETQNAPSQTFGVEGVGYRSWWPFRDKSWLHTAHAFGYLAPATPNHDPSLIHPVDSISADPTLKHTRITITLDR